MRALQDNGLRRRELGNVAKHSRRILSRRRRLPRGEGVKLEDGLDLVRLARLELRDFPAAKAVGLP